MRFRDGRWGRATFAVAALYGLLLSTFLGAMAPMAPAVAADLPCRIEAGGPAEPHAPVHRPDCCPLACATATAAPPTLANDLTPSPGWRAVAHGSVAATAAPPRPPFHRSLPRGPPAA